MDGDSGLWIMFLEAALPLVFIGIIVWSTLPKKAKKTEQKKQEQEDE